MSNIPSRFQGVEIPSDKPFQNDKLGYQKYAPILAGMVNMFKDSGCVLAVNGKWGTGKTTFLQMWSTALSSNLFKTIYFNAWETDYFTDPLVAILGELSEISQDNEQFRSVLATAAKVVGAGGGALLKGALKKFTGIDADVIGDSIDAVKSSFEDSLEDYRNQKESLSEFKGKLSEFVAGQDGKTVVFIIDELDRCNPHYAVRVLELVKHLFDVPNICFILAIDKAQLECSIKGFYGNNDIDAANYLRRFIDIEFRMPEPNLEGFTSVLFSHYHFQEFFDDLQGGYSDPKDVFCRMSTFLGNIYSTDLRTYDKILAHTRLALMQLGNDAILLYVVLYLCFVKVMDPAFYEVLSQHKYSVQELLEKLENCFPDSIFENDGFGSRNSEISHSIIYMIAPLIMLYNVENGVAIESGITRLDDNTEFPLTCRVIDKDALKGAMQWFGRFGSRYYGIRRVLKTINLLNQFY